MTERLVIAITGASGVIYGIRALQILRAMPNIETHLVMSTAAKQTIAAETDWTIAQVEQLAHVVHDDRQIGATIASGSFVTRGMIVMPCSIKSLSAIANSFSADLIARAADVTLKEGRPLILVVRETPFHLGHLRLMERASEMGAIVAPPIPAFYGRPQSLDEMIDGTVGRVLARLGFDNALFTHWNGMRDAITPTTTREKMSAFLTSQTTLALATINQDGSPYASDVFFAHDEKLALYFLSDPKTHHVQNLQRDARVSGTIHAATRGWQTIRGVQITGRAERVEDRAAAYKLYVAKYPFVQQWLPNAENLGRVLDKLGLIEMYKITPQWMRWIDNAEGFGHKEEIEL